MKLATFSAGGESRLTKIRRRFMLLGQTLEKVEADTDRDYFMSSEDAKNYGIIDSTVTRNIVTGGPR